MALLLSAQSLGHAFAARPLFQNVSFTVADGDRVGLIGPNGAGKSTLLKILAGELGPDEGEVAKRGGLRVTYLAQTPAFAPGATVRQAVSEGAPAGGGYEWEIDARVDELIAKLNLSQDGIGPDAEVSRLSGGWQKRVALARALAGEPELLLLDEPTNHLDVESILWLENLLTQARFATITITHDRAFLQKAANRILELDRRNAGGLLDVAGDYATYLERKAEAMAAQERREDTLRNTLRRETEWLRRGPPARTTKQEARIQRAGALAEEVGELATRNQQKGVSLDFQGVGRKPKRLIEAQAIGKSYGGRSVFDNISLFIGPGSRVALLGPNGCGKSTLLRVLVSHENPDKGQVLRAESLSVAWFEQDRGSLDPDQTLADAICPIGDHVDFRGARLHRYGYLERFLFRPEQMNLAVGKLSGGEQSRLLVARLMLKPASILVLDEPTNDLDLATLDVLQDALTSFNGAVLLVTHDRFFLDQVATQILAFHTHPDEHGRITSFADLNQWQAWHPSQLVQRSSKAEPKATVETKRKKLSYKDQREWDSIEARIETAEAAVKALEEECLRPDVSVNAARLLELHAEIDKTRTKVEGLYARWSELEAMIKGDA
ncbi:MAG: ABC-F family ATP-binding cassette domain-containing protein [Deltaproteobacteria bacterium]|nr:ABC-F family ATP-binding cassette domain-containing protein [Deltaproteobacteria bacterium]